MAYGGGDAVRAGIAGSDDDDVLPFGGDVFPILEIGIEQALGIGPQKLHGEINAPELATGDREVARFGGSTTQDDRIKFLEEPFGRIILAHLGIRHKLDSLVGQKVDPTLHDRLVQVRIRNAIHQ